MHLRRVLALLVTTAAAVTVPLVTAAPASAAISARVFGTEGVGLNVRTGPSTSGGVLTTVPENTSVSVSCQTSGATVNGTSVWDYLPAYRGYASDAYLWTGYDGFHPGLPRCGATTPPPPTDLRSRIVSVASAEVGNGHLAKYGGDPSWEWCSIFATWVWRQAGVTIPSLPFTGDVFTWVRPTGSRSGARPGSAPGTWCSTAPGPRPRRPAPTSAWSPKSAPTARWSPSRATTTTW